jgi:hypothetical protein
MKGRLDDLDDADLIAEVRARLSRSAGDDWVTAFQRGEALLTTSAAYVADCSADTVRRRAEAAARSAFSSPARFG